MFVGECKENPSLRKAGSCYYAMTNSPSKSCLGPFSKPIMPHFLAALAREGIGPTDKACFPGAGIFGFDGGLTLGENARPPLFPSGSVELADVGGDQLYFEGALRREVLEEAGIAPQMLMTENRWRAAPSAVDRDRSP